MAQAGWVPKLQEIVGNENVLWKEVDLAVYEYDASLYRGKPKAVVFTETPNQVSEVVKLLYAEGVPYVARGAGTNLSGGTVIQDGVVIEISRMDKILDIDLENQRALVEPGIYNLALQNALAPLGYYYAPDPASQKVSTLGGNVGENSGGPHCLKYGVTSNHVLGAEVVLPNGEMVWFGGKSLDAPGPDLMGLLVGSEGTLGIATKILVRIMRSPERVVTMLAVFNSIEEAGQTVSDIIAEGIIPATLEIMDNLVIRAVEDSVHAGYPTDADAVLIIELDGLDDGMEEQAEKIREICEKSGVVSIRRAKDAAERAELWAGRKGAFGAVARLRPSYLVCDGTVPRTKLPEALREVKRVSEKYDLPIGNVFHAGDGNLHPLILFDDRDPDEMARVHQAGSEILQICADLGGTISGEHGIGAEKLKEMSFVFRDADIEMMRLTKSAIDPKDLSNPGKLIPCSCIRRVSAIDLSGIAFCFVFQYSEFQIASIST
jgi:glycolate oxidase subunit GlcD